MNWNWTNPTIGDEDKISEEDKLSDEDKFDEIVDENFDELTSSSIDESVDMDSNSIGQVEPFVVGKHDLTLYVERVQALAILDLAYRGGTA